MLYHKFTFIGLYMVKKGNNRPKKGNCGPKKGISRPKKGMHRPVFYLKIVYLA